MYPRHPAAEIFEPLEGQDFLDLCASMKRYGFLAGYEIVLHDGQVLDGWNRQRAAEVAGKPALYRQYEGEVDVLDYVIAANLTRRHLSLVQKAEAAQRLLEKLKAEASRRQRRGQPSANGEKGTAADLAGRKFGISGDSVMRMAMVTAKGIPELVHAVRAESLPLATAAQIAALPPAKQRESLAMNKVEGPIPASFKLSPAAIDLVDRLATRLQITKSGIIELAVFELAKRRRVS
jgi:hypothetical protein